MKGIVKTYTVSFANLTTASIKAPNYKTAGRLAREKALKEKTLVVSVKEN